MTQNRSSLQSWFVFLVFWILVNALGVVLVYAMMLLLTEAAMDLLSLSLIPAVILFAGPLAGGLGGAVAGFGQWAALRRRLPGAQSWALVTILGWIFGLILAAAMFAWLLPGGLGYLTLLVPIAVGGGAAGFAQERIVKKWVSGRNWWVLASSSGWVLGWIVGLVTSAYVGQEVSLSPGLGILLLGALHGGIIGLQSGMTLVILITLLPLTNTQQ